MLFVYVYIIIFANIQRTKTERSASGQVVRYKMQSYSATSYTVNGERSTSSRQRLRDSGQTSGQGEQNNHAALR